MREIGSFEITRYSYDLVDNEPKIVISMVKVLDKKGKYIKFAKLKEKKNHSNETDSSSCRFSFNIENYVLNNRLFTYLDECDNTKFYATEVDFKAKGVFFW